MPRAQSEIRLASAAAPLAGGSDYGERKRAGAFFTPWPVARCLADRAVARLDRETLAAGPTVCDPFVGAGVLLLAAAQALVEVAPPTFGGASRLLHGVDVDGDALAAAAGALRAEGLWAEGAVATQLHRFDTLLAPPLAGAWQAAFPAVMARGGFDLVLTNPPWEKVRVNEREFFARWLPDLGQLLRPERERACRELLRQPSVAADYETYRGRIAELTAVARRDYATSGSGGDLDMYKLAVERAVELLRPGGIAGLIVPHGLLGDWGARRLRAWLLDRHTILEVVRFETGPQLFPEIHANLGVVLLLVRRGQERRAQAIAVTRGVRTAAELVDPPTVDVPVALVRRATPQAMVPLVEGAVDLAFLAHCQRFPALAEWPDGCFRPRREVDMTLDRAHFRPVGAGVPLLEGKHLGPFRLPLTPRGRDVDAGRAAAFLAPRVAWRAVADRAMRRRLVAAWVPPGVALGNSLIASSAEGAEAVAELLWLLAWLNSRVAEAQLRLWSANNNINLHHLRALRAPVRTGAATDQRLVALAAGLMVASAADWSPPEAVVRLAADVPDASAGVAELDDLWCTRYGLPEALWEEAVAARTAAVL